MNAQRRWMVFALYPDGQWVPRHSFDNEAQANRQCFRLNSDLNEIHHHFVRETPRGTLTLYGYDEISKQIGVEIGTLRAWKARGKMPQPDYLTLTGRPVPGWLPETIEQWIASREKK